MWGEPRVFAEDPTVRELCNNVVKEWDARREKGGTESYWDPCSCACRRLASHLSVDEASKYTAQKLLQALDAERDRAVADWKIKNEYNLLIEMYAEHVEYAEQGKADYIRARNALAMLRRVSTYFREDRAVTPGSTRLAKLIKHVDDFLSRDGMGASAAADKENER